MLKVEIFVRCDSWTEGGYTNILYFATTRELDRWIARHPYCKITSVKRVSLEQFAEDYMYV